MTTATCYTVHDRLGFDALPTGTKLEDADGDRFEKMEEGYRAYGDDAPYYGYLYLEKPAVVLNPEVLGTFPLQPGDRAVITDGLAKFLDLKVEVLKSADTAWDQPWVQPLSERPDGHGLSPFYWPASQLTAIPTEPLKVGDRVRRISDQHFIRKGSAYDYADRECEKGEVGTVSKFSTVDGDGVGVKWDKGNFSYISASQLAPCEDPTPTYSVGDRVLVAYDRPGHHCWDGPGTVTDVRGRVIIVQPDHMDGSGGFHADSLSPYVDPEPEPVYENFELAGAYFKGRDVLDNLPEGSLVKPLGYVPIVKHAGDWRCVGHIGYDHLVNVPWVTDSAISNGAVVLYVPGEVG